MSTQFEGTMPAGRYYIGDLCYVMHDAWDEFCEDAACLDGQFTLRDGRKYAAYGTAWGDGTYRSSDGASIPVDAGLIGCIRVEDIKDEGADLLDAHVVEFREPFHTGAENGVIQFGHIYIDTAGDNGDDDEDQDDVEQDD